MISKEEAMFRANVVSYGEHGETQEFIEVQPGHLPHVDGICPTCGRVANNGPKFDREAWLSREQKVCFERADWVIELSYLARDDQHIYRAIYGVTPDKTSCWAD